MPRALDRVSIASRVLYRIVVYYALPRLKSTEICGRARALFNARARS